MQETNRNDPKKLFRTQVTFKNKEDKDKFSKLYRKGLTEEDISKMTKKKFKTTEKKKHVTIYEKEDVNKVENKMLGEYFDNGYKEISQFSEGMMKNNLYNLSNQINVNLNSQFVLTSPVNYNDKYRYYDNLISIEKDYQIQKMMNKTGGNQRFKLQYEVDKVLEKQKHELEQEKKLDLRRLWKRVLISAAVHFKRLDISIKEVYII